MLCLTDLVTGNGDHRTRGKEKDDGEVERAWCYEDGAVQQVGIAMRMTRTREAYEVEDNVNINVVRDEIAYACFFGTKACVCEFMYADRCFFGTKAQSYVCCVGMFADMFM